MRLLSCFPLQPSRLSGGAAPSSPYTSATSATPVEMMAPPTLPSLELPPDVQAIVDEAIACGRFRSADEVAAAALRRLAAESGAPGANEARLAATLRETEERLRLMSDHLPGMIYQIVVDADGQRRFQYVSAGV